MKRSTTKKTDKSATKNEEFVDDSAWFDVMRATLSPYWSARAEYLRERQPHRSDNEANAA
jgi:hypothetical protein